MTATDEYVPIEDDVKFAWADRRLFLDSLGDGASSPDAVYEAEFDRFLAKVKRTAAREALTRMVEDGKREGMRQFHLMTINAYRDQIYPEETP